MENGIRHLRMDSKSTVMAGISGESPRTRYEVVEPAKPYEGFIESRQPGCITLHVKSGLDPYGLQRRAAQVAAVEGIPVTFTHNNDQTHTINPGEARKLLTPDNIYKRIASHKNNLKGLVQSIERVRQEIADKENYEIKGLYASMATVQKEIDVENYVGKALYDDGFLEESPHESPKLRFVEDVTREEIASAIGGVADTQTQMIKHHADFLIYHSEPGEGYRSDFEGFFGSAPILFQGGPIQLPNGAIILNDNFVTFVKTKKPKEKFYKGVTIDRDGDILQFTINEQSHMLHPEIAEAAQLAYKRYELGEKSNIPEGK